LELLPQREHHAPPIVLVAAVGQDDVTLRADGDLGDGLAPGRLEVRRRGSAQRQWHEQDQGLAHGRCPRRWGAVWSALMHPRFPYGLPSGTSGGRNHTESGDASEHSKPPSAWREIGRGTGNLRRRWPSSRRIV